MLTEIVTGLVVSVLATSAGMFLPDMLHGIRNLPWEVAFGLGCSLTWYSRNIVGEHIEGLLGLVVWPVIVIVLLWVASFRLARAGVYARVVAASGFFISLLVCVPADTANELGSRIPLFRNELTVRY
jgi:hypothetical protein